MGSATRELNTVIEKESSKDLKPNLQKMNSTDLDKYADEKYGIDTSQLNKKEKIKEIKTAEINERQEKDKK